MPITQSLNSKANVKKNTTNDLPFSPQQPVLSYYGPVNSTANQTVIALTFSIDTVNNPQALWLMVDGKKLSLTQDYTFTSIAVDGTTSQVTLKSPLAAGMNIEAYKMGLKKESEFGVDNRFVALYEAEGQAFQGFVNTQTNLITATSTAGTPAAGTFYSTIVGRAAIVDMSQDLKPRMGIERLPVQQIYQLQNEFGPNGEPVWATPNDTTGQIRFVGSWITNINVGGPYCQNLSTTDFLEITFYGTGLNVLHRFDATTPTYAYSVDGGSSTSYLTVNPSAIISGRNYAANEVVPVVSGLSLGIHTVKLTFVTGNGNFYGFEILNESSSVKVNPGAAYVGGQKLTLSAQSAFAFNSVVTGTKGGRVLVYQKSDGTIAQVFQAVNTSQANLTSTDHTNEEAVRTYSIREFGAGRSDDFSGAAGAASNKAFTLDDGTTTLITSSTAGYATSTEGVEILNMGIGSFFTITFVGTGLDIVGSPTDVVGNNVGTVAIDGTTLGSQIISLGVGLLRTYKIVSGLPYGTHTVRVTRTTEVVRPSRFIVYQPKKPSLPTGAIELADYNVMATFAANSTAAADTISTGVLRKDVTREVVYVEGSGGSQPWIFNGTKYANGTAGSNELIDNNANCYAQYTFFGTGFDLRFFAAANRSASIQVSLNGLNATTTNFVSLTASGYGGGSFNTSTGIMAQNGTTNAAAGVVLSGLPLGVYTVKFLNNTANSYLSVSTLDIITPIHSVKSNIYADLQNTLPVGSQSISDNRKTTAIKDALPATKAWAEAFGISSGPTTSSTSYVPMPDMSLTLKVAGGPVLLGFAAAIYNSGAGNATNLQLYVDGTAVPGPETNMVQPVANQPLTMSNAYIVNMSPGIHKIDLYWIVGAGTSTVSGVRRNMYVREL